MASRHPLKRVCARPSDCRMLELKSPSPMSRPYKIIHVHPAAPQKPAEGTPCNGCGVCCLTEPCPLGVFLSGRRRGACDALIWHEDGRMYRCGAISAPTEVLERALPRWLRPVAKGMSPFTARLAKRWIAAGQGCDSSLEISPPPKGGSSPGRTSSSP